MTEEAFLQFLVEHAARMRAAGVLKARVDPKGEFSFELVPHEPVITVSTESEIQEQLDPLMDPTTFGRRDGTVPGFPRRPRDEDE